ncbi:LysE/ArgO family amino acid transporter [Dysosmobacter sp.]|uniref:LysE/ArgO family amino acid transporter n=1 Tax=Dysosmobacter sp. TaxID=2591382 RepID=UPI002A8914C7|nr:LysE family transporter [Dysosmobacter sp.]MDY3281400.1 LysE family transporter [Dysosmobacter sp.]
MAYYLQGLTMGLAYVAPVGLQNLFVIHSALSSSRRRALLTSLIVIFFDVTLALACFFGVGAVMVRYPWLQKVILLAGSLIVLFIGVTLLRSQPEDIRAPAAEISLWKTISTACVVTWCNPQAILDGTMMLGAFHASLPPAQSTAFISGVATASCLWFPSLTWMISVFREQFNARVLRAINRVCGAVILFYGGKLLWSFLTRL